MSDNKQSENVMSLEWKQLTCQASYCQHNNRHGLCLHDYMELDDHGICIFFEKRSDLFQPDLPKNFQST